MGKVILEVSMSLDGFSAGTDVGKDHPLGIGGEKLHEWLFEGTAFDKRIGEESHDNLGAVITGRTTYDVGVDLWEDVPWPVPTIVLTHESLEDRPMKSGTFSYVSGIEQALERARQAADGRNILVMGGADGAHQFLAAGLIDQIRLHVAHVLLGDGLRLFDGVGPNHAEFALTSSESTVLATHLVLEVIRPEV